MAARGVALSHRLPERQLKQAFDMVLIVAPHDDSRETRPT